MTWRDIWVSIDTGIECRTDIQTVAQKRELELKRDDSFAYNLFMNLSAR